MSRMRRTQVYLEPELSQALDRLAHEQGTSKANLIRRAAWGLVEREQGHEEDPILELIGLGDSGRPGRTSEEHDRALMEHSLERRA